MALPLTVLSPQMTQNCLAAEAAATVAAAACAMAWMSALLVLMARATCCTPDCKVTAARTQYLQHGAHADCSSEPGRLSGSQTAEDASFFLPAYNLSLASMHDTATDEAYHSILKMTSLVLPCRGCCCRRHTVNGCPALPAYH